MGPSCRHQRRSTVRRTHNNSRFRWPALLACVRVDFPSLVEGMRLDQGKSDLSPTHRALVHGYGREAPIV
jgi:hypothetical protein